MNELITNDQLGPVVERMDNAMHQAPVVERVYNAVHRINHYPADSVFVLPTLIHWIPIYLVDSVIHLLNN